MAEAYPLSWPDGWARTRVKERSRFKTGFGAARNLLAGELERTSAKNVVLSTSLPLRIDGQPRANATPLNGEVGVALYFTRKNRQTVFACDKYDRLHDNIYSIAKTLEAMRAIERWGAAELMDRAFTGFSALPAKATSAWRDVLEVSELATMAEIDSAFKRLAVLHHPDRGGDSSLFQSAVQAREDARKELGAALT